MTNYARLRCLECQNERERGGAEREREGRGEGEARGNYSLWSGRAEERASAKVASCDKATANGPSVMQVPSPPHPPPLLPPTPCECSQLADGQFESSEWVSKGGTVEEGEGAEQNKAIERVWKVEQGCRAKQ